MYRIGMAGVWMGLVLVAPVFAWMTAVLVHAVVAKSWDFAVEVWQMWIATWIAAWNALRGKDPL